MNLWLPMCAKSPQSCPTLCYPMNCSPPGSSVHRNSPVKNTRVVCHALLQGIFPTQGLNLCLLWFLHCRRSHWGRPWLPVHTYIRWMTNKDLLYSTQNAAQCYVSAWMGGEFGRDWIHVHVWLSPFAVCLKLLQHC